MQESYRSHFPRESYFMGTLYVHSRTTNVRPWTEKCGGKKTKKVVRKSMSHEIRMSLILPKISILSAIYLQPFFQS